MAYAEAVAHSTAADGTFSAAGATAWNAAHTVTYSGVVSGGIPYGTSTTAQDYSALLASGGVVLGGGAGAAPFTSANLTFGAATGEGLVYAAGTATTDVAAMSLTRTNNNSAVSKGVLWTFTDTTSAATFKPFQILGGSAGTTNLFSLSKAGAIVLAANASISSTTNSTFTIITAGAGGNGTLVLGGSSTTGTMKFQVDGVSISLLSGGILGFTSGDVNAALDSAFSRVSAGVIGVGTGAAASVAGSLSMNNCKAVSYTVGTTAGASFGPAAVASITVVNGIITAIS